MSVLAQRTRTVVKIVSVVAILMVVNFAVAQWDVKWDMTKSGLYSLSEQSRTIAEGVQKDVELIFFHFDSDQGRVSVDPHWVRTLLKEYASLSDSIQYREVNPNVSPSAAREYQIRRNNSVVVRVGEKHQKVGPYDLVNFSRGGPNTFRGEVAVTNALQNLTTVTNRTVWFMTGHGEMGPEAGRGRRTTTLSRSISNGGFSVESFNPLEREFPSTEDLIVLLDPQSNLSQSVVERLVEWHENGGALLLAANPQHRSMANQVTEPLGARMTDRQILGQNWRFYYRSRGNPFLFSPSLHSHPITSPLGEEGISVILGRSSPLDVDTGVFSPLLETSAEAYAKPMVEGQRRIEPAFDETEDVRGPFTVAAVNDGSDTSGKMIVMSSAQVFGDQLISRGGNEDLALNMVNWLLERRISLGIQPKTLSGNVVKNISPTQAYVIQIMALLVIPFSVLFWGGYVWWTRKNR
jgi:hypothetical protein